MAETEPIAIVCVGMAGSGKTTFMQRINHYLHLNKKRPYVMNLDPAVLNIPYEANIDIRDSINYKEVMKQYSLGPNGGILTSLNLFSTKIDQIISLLEKRAHPEPETKVPPPDYFLVDTPGQIEVFVWSASGSILLESLASSFPTVIAYIIDTPRSSSTSTFMSNMLYACSILYKTKLPMILVFNKSDVHDAEFAREWMTDFEKFQEALHAEEEKGVFGGEGFGGGSGYMGSLLNSMSLMLEEFYTHLSMVAVSSMNGDGIDEFFDAAEQKRDEFIRDYRPELERRRAERQSESAIRKQQELSRVLKDMNIEPGSGPSGADATKSDDAHSVAEDQPDEEQVDPDDYPDAEKEDNGRDDEFRKRYQDALKEQGIQVDESDRNLAKFVNQRQ